MSGSYPIVVVQPDWRIAAEEMGSKRKFWYRNPESDTDWLFKFPQVNTGQHWAEKIAAEVASHLGILHAKVELAVFRGTLGPDFADYLRYLDLPDGADPIEILRVNGGSRVTDTYEVFPKLVKHEDGSFTCRFFLHGWRYAKPTAQDRLDKLAPGEELHVKVQHDNPVDGLAVQMLTTDRQMIGWTPRYLVNDLAKAMTHAPDKYKAKVVKINPQPAPSKQRVLIEMTGNWGQHEPMTGEDFMPLVANTP